MINVFIQGKGKADGPSSPLKSLSIPEFKSAKRILRMLASRICMIAEKSLFIDFFQQM